MKTDTNVYEQRAALARQALDDEITNSSASPVEKAYMRQKLAHLWTLARSWGGGEA